MNAGELRAITCLGGLVWSASPVRFVTEDGQPVTVLEHRVSQCSEVSDAGVRKMTGVPVLTLVVRVHGHANGVAAPQEPVKDALGHERIEAKPNVASSVAGSVGKQGW